MRKEYILRETKFKTKIGNETIQYAITLPTETIKRFGWKKGDKFIILDGDDTLVIKKNEL